MDYWSRLILAAIMGVGVGLGLGYLLGNVIIWIFVSLAIALATETSLRTVKNVKAPPNPVLDKSPYQQLKDGKLPRRKPPKPNF